MADDDGWEYQHIEALTSSGDLANVTAKLNELGALGWEIVGFATADRTVGFNAVFVYIRRRLERPEPPIGGQQAAWLTDPTGRFEQRYFDGRQWTAHVANPSKKIKAIDPPTMRRSDA